MMNLPARCDATCRSGGVMTFEKIAVVGVGRFGRLLAEILGGDFDVVVHGRRSVDVPVGAAYRAVSRDEALAADAVFYAVPISSFEAVLAAHLPALLARERPPLLVDVLSVKLHPKRVFEALLPPHVEAMLTHPMFGPDSVSALGLAGLPIVLDRFRASPETYRFWRAYFEGKRLRVIELAADEHDRLAAYSQGVAHFIGRVLDEMQLRQTPIDTVGTRKLLEIREQTCNDTWELFTDLQTKNPYTLEMRVALGRAVDAVYNRLLPDRVDTDRLVVGIQGGRGSFNEQAALYYLGREKIDRYDIRYLHTTAAVLEALHEGRVDRGQFAVHNSVGGIVHESIEAMQYSKFRIVEEFSVKIAHALMIRADARLADVDTIMTHPQVLRQCRQTLSEKYLRLRLTSGEGELIDHALVAERLAQGGLPRNVATMGSRLLAEIHGLHVVEDDLQDAAQNFTAFLWVQRP
jgi:prephenate dehydrogenase